MDRKLDFAAMRKLWTAAAALLLVGACGAPTAAADSTQPAGSIPIPDGPAQT